MEFPSAFKKRIVGQLPQEADLFFEALSQPAPVSIRINPYKTLKLPASLEPIPWNKYGYYLSERPVFTLDPAFHAGGYYVQEASSMCLDFLLEQLDLESPLALDLCAAPGGKSSLMAANLYEKGGLVLANEVIRNRVQVLKENLIKWGLPNVAVSNLDPRHITESGVRFDLIVVDAPCSGEGLFRKDPNAGTEWTEEGVLHCAGRQKRILSDILPALKPGGYLIYSTCTWSEAENEENLAWLTEEMGLESIALPFPADWNITESRRRNSVGYRFYPHKTKGEGLFIAVMKRPGEANTGDKKPASLPGKSSRDGAPRYTLPEQHLFEWFDGWYAIPQRFSILAGELFHSLPLQYLGTRVAEAAGKELKPAPELAFSILGTPDLFPEINLSLPDALRFLRRDELNHPFKKSPAGWLKVGYEGLGLGYVKNLGSRVNSQYPKAWRIRMDLPAELRTFRDSDPEMA